jgi:hypothetical protein
MVEGRRGFGGKVARKVALQIVVRRKEKGSFGGRRRWKRVNSKHDRKFRRRRSECFKDEFKRSGFKGFIAGRRPGERARKGLTRKGEGAKNSRKEIKRGL